MVDGADRDAVQPHRRAFGHGRGIFHISAQLKTALEHVGVGGEQKNQNGRDGERRGGQQSYA